MALTSGTKLGPYEILAPLGAGGMGEVYRARDTRLEREVAVKVLPANLSSESSLKQRLEREAKAVSKLSHPHICTLHDIGSHGGTDFIVMELVEGETLEQRLGKGPLASEQVLRYGAQIADALAKAHKHGFTHRDLKPANVMLTKSGAKLMDFGLAKVSMQAPPAVSSSAMTADQAKLTAEGSLVGTFQYMAPEQLEGKEADARTDIFALGEVLYEMATGKAPFSGSSQASLIAAILTKEPRPMTELQPLTPMALERAVKKCMAKDPEDRWQSAGDLASELNWIAEAGSQAGIAAPAILGRRRLERAGWVLAALLLVALAAVAVSAWRESSRRPAAMHFQAPLSFPANDLALAPDGRTVVMVAYAERAHNYMLWTYEVGSRRSEPMEGTQGASYPFWAPDGRNIGFFADGKLKTVSASGGPISMVCDAPNGRGATWNQDGVIVFAPEALGGLMKVAASGGTPVTVSTPDASRSESGHRWPVFLPDGKHYIYLAANFSDKPGINALFIGALGSDEKHMLVHASANAVYAKPGYLLYLRDKTLVAQPLDLGRYELTGEPRTLSDEVLYFPQVYRAVFDASSNGVLVTQVGKGVFQSELAWFDRAGKQVGSVGKPAWYDNLQIAPDGRRVATDETDPDGRNVDVWVHDPVNGTAARLTFDPALDITPVWSRDGRQLIYTSNRSLNFHLYVKNADGSGSDEEIVGAAAEQMNPTDWSRDGKYILIRRSNQLWYLTWPEKQMKALLQSKAVNRSARFSPDGRWVAYSNNEAGSSEVYVSPFPGFSGKWQVSTQGGQEPMWRADGKEIFYLSPDAKMMAAPVVAGTTSFQSGTPVTLFQTRRRQPVSSQDIASYGVSADGQRFLIATKVDEANTTPLSITLNWPAELEK